LNQLANGFRVEYDFLDQLGGIWLFRKAIYISSNSYEISTNPLIANCNYCRDDCINSNKRLNLSISYSNTVDNDWIEPLSANWKCFGLQLILSNLSGN